MAATPIPIYEAPFQGGTNGTDITTTAAGIVIAGASEMTFVNDGYTILFVTNAGTASNITITSVEDNAGREQHITAQAVGTLVTRAYGPFRPVWWNYGGVVRVTFSSVATIKVAAIRFQF